MSSPTGTPIEPAAFTISRTVDAPRDLVWQAWTDPKALSRWFGPKGFETRSSKLELRPGGVFHYSMAAGGQTMWGKFIYREIAPPERLVFIVSFSDVSEGVTRHPMSVTWPLETLSTVSLSEAGGRTTVSLTGVPIKATDAERRTFTEGFDSMRQGWSGTFDQLDAFLAEHKEQHPNG